MEDSSPATRWFALAPDEVLAQLKSSERNGLSGSKAAARLVRYGLNELGELRDLTTILAIVLLDGELEKLLVRRGRLYGASSGDA